MTQSFANRDTYDLKDFAARLKGVAGAEPLHPTCDALIKSFDAARIRSTALGPTVSDAQGLAFWFPANRSAFNEVAGTYSKLRFSEETGWTEYLRGTFRA